LKGEIMTKSELIAELAKKSDLTKADSERVLNAFIDVAKKTLKKDGKLALPGFGAFVVSKRKARKGRNPQTGQTINIKASKVVRFRAGKALKESL
jgi:DNA-binding protein HU-beta